MIIPDVQYPHCIAPTSRNASCTGCRLISGGQPFDGRDLLLNHCSDSVMQDRCAFPSIKTVQAPHCPSPQPYLLPVKSSCSRNTFSKLV